MKKAQGLSMSVIVMAALALLILVVLALIFTGRIGIFSKEVAACKNQGGVCAEECGVGVAAKYPSEYGPASAACVKANELKPVCCIPIE